MSVARQDGAAPLDVLYETTSGAPETDAERRYGAPLRFPDAPCLVANFVSTIDGVVARGGTPGGDVTAIGGKSSADRWVMAMLRAAADAIVIGAGTLRATGAHQWTASHVAPSSAEELASYRTALGRASGTAPLVVVTGSGELPRHVAVTQPATEVVFITTHAGDRRLAVAFPGVRRVVLGDGARIDGSLISRAVHTELGAQTVVCEGGPTLFGTFLASWSARELFLTIAPHFAGRSPVRRDLGLVEGLVGSPSANPFYESELRSVRRAGDHLLLRYRLSR